MLDKRSTDHRKIYTITEMEQISGLAAHTLRWYEQLGLIHDVSRGPGGHRRYSSDHLSWLELIGVMRAAGLSVDDMIRFAALIRQGDETLPARFGIVQQYRDDFRQEVAQRDEALRRLESLVQILDSPALDEADDELAEDLVVGGAKGARERVRKGVREGVTERRVTYAVGAPVLAEGTTRGGR
ncbi:MerR family transcriptional regulator [Actinacidiphila sp. ITFR-21]|uniref:MerR family transcriptional regulator n=1 Tax=Actinacidiphila sp. ITFR-21 TaxID=3075199 RepID=UPI00288B3B7D|nr:MerR family transcriptional regulator [Streptomyces sp. ITFR-21]WNI17851.1 MerR family transcriptional regulator [Streptomyces sp. ITFR-21]